MEFKTKTEREQYRSRQLHPRLMDLLTALDALAAVAKQPLMITSIHRAADTHSYHSKWQAVDLRVLDWKVEWQQFVILIILKMRCYDRAIQFELEPSDRHPKSDPHLHIEYDDNTLNKEKVV